MGATKLACSLSEVFLKKRPFFFIKNDGEYALSNVSFDCNINDRIGIAGASGSGKTILLKVIGGIIRPTSGNLSFHNGSDFQFLTPNGLFFMNLSVRRNIISGLTIRGASKEDAYQLTGKVLDDADLSSSNLDVNLSGLSNVMRARLFFSIVYNSTRSSHLLLDHGISVGAGEYRKKSLKMMCELIEKSKSVIISSQSKEFLSSHCNKIVTLERGRVASIVDVS